MNLTHCFAISFAAQILSAALFSSRISASGVITIYDSEHSKDADGLYFFMDTPAQRCYSLSRFSDKVSYVTWSKIQSFAFVAFYKELQCKGNATKLFAKSGNFMAKDYNMDNKVKSLMALESGVYPTRGIEDAARNQTLPTSINDD